MMLGPRAARAKRLATRIALFAAPPLLAAFAPLLVLSSIARTSGTPVWVSLLLGQAIGSIGCLITTWGWDIGGPARAAAAGRPERRALLALSLANRLPIALVVMASAIAASAALAPAEGKVLAVAAAIAGTAQGLSLNWWFTAIGRPGGIVLTDALPRTAAAAVSVPLIWIGLPALVYPLLGATMTFVAYCLGYRGILRGVEWPARREVWSSIRADTRLALIAVTTSAYTTATLPLVQWINPLAAPAFGAAQRIAGYWTFGTVVLGNTAQNWVNQHGRSAVHRRARTALVVFTIEGLVLGSALWLVGPLVGRLIFGVESPVPQIVFAAFAATFLAVAMSTALGRLFLIPLGREKEVGTITLVTAAVGVASLCVGAGVAGAVGASLALAGTEIFATLLLACAAIRIALRLRSAAPHELAPVPVPVR